MGKKKSMHYQAALVLGAATCTGRSKFADKKPSNNNHPYGVYSVGTRDNYIADVDRFGRFCEKTFGETDLTKCFIYIPAYLDYLKAKGRAVTTLHKYKFAIQKYYDAIFHGYKVDYDTGKRTRTKITKNRTSISEVPDFDEKKHEFALNFGKATGLRISEMKTLRYNDIIYNQADDSFSVFVFKGKGGKQRISPVLPEYYSMFRKIYYSDHSDKNIFYTKKKIVKQNLTGIDESHILPVRFPEHRCRRSYANTWYEKLARDTDTITMREEKYVCRKDLKGTIYDRTAMLSVSKFLGHNRVSVIAEHYLGKTETEE